MKNSTFIEFIPILIVLIFISLCEGDIFTFTFYEENLSPQKMVPYPDNSLAFRLVTRLNDTCNVPTLTYRILYPNGTNNLITVNDHHIPSFNFCINGNRNQTQDKVLDDEIVHIKTIPNYILVMYSRITIEHGKLQFGMTIDWSGKVVSDTLLGNIYNPQRATLFQQYYKPLNPIIYMDEDNQYNYFIVEKIENSHNIIVKKFIISSHKGELDKVQEDLIQMPEGYERFNTYITIDYKILFVFIHKLENNTSILEPEWKIYGAILQNGSNQLNPFLIYQISTPRLELTLVICDQFYDGNGFFCHFGFENLDDYNNFMPTITVTFLSNGKIIETKKNIDLDISNIAVFDFFTLQSGGVIIIIPRNVNNKCTLSAYLLKTNSNFSKAIDSKTIDTNVSCIDIVAETVKNNTGLVVQEINENYWTLLSVDIPSLMIDKGYENPIINWTIPAINETISIGTTQIQISYNVPIECSSQNISIYQKVNDTNDILRETYSGKSNNCQVLSDNTTLSLTVLSSTFNQPSSIYYVKIDADFVKCNTTLEPLVGISTYKWTFFTESHQYEIYDTFHSFVRLTPDATLYFENLSSKERKSFYQNLTNQFTEIIPIPNDRIFIENYHKKDSIALNQILIPVEIIKLNDVSVIDVLTIANTLDTLIKNKEITLISKNTLTSMLDESYGLKEHKTFLEFITIPVIVMGCVLLILSLCYIWARKRCKEGKNFTIIMMSLMLYDVIMDLLFIFDLKNKNMMLLFWMSLVCTILPILINLFAALYIISKENSENPHFYKYFLSNPTMVSICSVISGADIEILQILSSRFAGFNTFTAPFSNKAEKFIFWCALIGFCFEDIPQFAIQIAYRTFRVEYTIIPALTLISSSLMLLNNITRRLYLVIIKCRSFPSSIDDIISHYYYS